LKIVSILNKTKNCVLGDAIGRADTSQTRRTGLLKKTGLLDGEGLWILPCEGIHTFFMKFAIDVLFLDKKRSVVKLVHSMGPWRMAISFRAHSVLELPAGTIVKTGTMRGDLLEVTDTAPVNSPVLTS
jgi:uncharacterized membrane protein (UPF0127 family)